MSLSKTKKLCTHTYYNWFIWTHLLKNERTLKQSTSPTNIWKLVGVVFDRGSTKYYLENNRLQNLTIIRKNIIIIQRPYIYYNLRGDTFIKRDLNKVIIDNVRILCSELGVKVRQCWHLSRTWQFALIFFCKILFKNFITYYV